MRVLSLVATTVLGVTAVLLPLTAGAPAAQALAGSAPLAPLEPALWPLALQLGAELLVVT